jgi:hypothetical protein
MISLSNHLLRITNRALLDKWLQQVPIQRASSRIYIMQGMSRDQKKLEKAIVLANEKLLEKIWFGCKFKRVIKRPYVKAS